MSHRHRGLVAASLATLAALSTTAPAAAEPPAPRPQQRLRLDVGLGVLTEHNTERQVMEDLDGSILVRWDRLVAGGTLAVHTTGTNDTKTDVGLRLGVALDADPEWEVDLTAMLGRRSQTKGRLIYEDPGGTEAFAVAGADLDLHHHRSRPGGFTWGLGAFARYDLATFEAPTSDFVGPREFGGTFELGVALRIGFDGALGYALR